MVLCPLCVVHFGVSSDGRMGGSRHSPVPMVFGRPDDVLLFDGDEKKEKARNSGLAGMKHYGGSIDIFTTEFNVNRSAARHGMPSPTFMLELYNALTSKDSAPNDFGFEKKAIRQSDTIRSITAKLVDLSHHEPLSQVLQRYVFDLTVITRSERLRLAELRIPVPSRSPRKSKKTRVTLYQLHEVACDQGTTAGTCYRRDAVTSQRVRQDHVDKNDGSVVFQVTKAVKHWIKSTRGRHVIEVGIPEDLVDDVIKVREDLIDSEAQLVTFTFTKVKGGKGSKEGKETKKRQRSARATDAEARRQKKIRDRKKQLRKKKLKELAEKSKRQHPCKREDLIADFEQIGWGSWIIYPKRFNAYQCVGSCPAPMDSLHNPNNHAIMRGLLHLKNPDLIPLPCCVPTKLSSLSMLYYEHGKIVVKEHEAIIVEECGCR
uniref:Nodal n=1 Tax=Ptychodera flava TaxID=63121 RepID=A0A0D3S0Z8_PTYFL|nr:nodal [Ptychodera flava]